MIVGPYFELGKDLKINLSFSFRIRTLSTVFKKGYNKVFLAGLKNTF